MTKTYEIKCIKCEGSSKLEIVDSKLVNYIDQTPIISSRKRGDLKWGFECICGNDSRLAVEELGNRNLVKGSGQEVIDAVIDNMWKSTDDNFIMTEI